jgi:hypothetical protein
MKQFLLALTLTTIILGVIDTFPTQTDTTLTNTTLEG